MAAAQRHGWSWQAPARRALERDEHAIEWWKKEVRPRVKGSQGPMGCSRRPVAVAGPRPFGPAGGGVAGERG
ncbi:winged helix-turn-helix domain-containing protein [Streptomyces sp. NPDC013455]|uniref:winged helix-turn-helix domain-containing protein n=1 Tax=Streptomyces sp. NPDC013455 TaxID=3155605 RepID=UPI0033CB9CDC